MIIGVSKPEFILEEGSIAELGTEINYLVNNFETNVEQKGKINAHLFSRVTGHRNLYDNEQTEKLNRESYFRSIRSFSFPK